MCEVNKESTKRTEQLNITLIENNMKRYMLKRQIDIVVRRDEKIILSDVRNGRGRLKKISLEIINKNLNIFIE